MFYSLLFVMHFLDTGIWTKIISSGDGPSARFSMSGDCLDPSKGGVLVFIGGCNKNLEALDDMYFLHTGRNIIYRLFLYTYVSVSFLLWCNSIWLMRIIFPPVEMHKVAKCIWLHSIIDTRNFERWWKRWPKVGKIISQKTAEDEVSRTIHSFFG